MPHSEDTDWLNGYRNKTHTHTHTHAVLKRPTSDLRTYKLKGDGERYSIQMKIKESWNSNTHIRQNRL